VKPHPRAAIVIAIVAILAIALTYFDAARLGFIWDDYLILRPRPWTELLRVWHGSWDATGFSEPFYRPLAVWTDTAAFAAFGFNEGWLRLTALIELGMGAWLIGLFVSRETTSMWLGAFAAAVFAVHPAISQSAGPWWFEQNHRFSVICVAAALLAWQSRRGTLTWRSWSLVHVTILIGSWFKEDVLTLAPILLLFQWWRAQSAGDVPRLTMRFVAEISAAWACWFGLRWWLLGVVAGRPIGGPLDDWGDRLHHAGRGLWLTFIRVRAMQGEVEIVHQVATVTLVISLLLAVWTWRRAPTHARALMGYGLIAGGAFNVPVAIASYPTRYHLITIGAVLLLAGTAAAWQDIAPRLRTAISGACVALIIVLSLSSRANMRIYAPCTEANLDLDLQLRAWLEGIPYWSHSWILPWLDDKAARCAEHRYVPTGIAIPDVLRAVSEGRR